MTTAPPQYSPDGRWWWDGTQWVPTQPQPYGQLPSPESDGKGIASFVCSIVWAFGLGSIAAVVLGHLSRSDAKKQNRPPSGLSTAGLVIGYLGLAGALAIVGLFAVGVGTTVERVGSAHIATAVDPSLDLQRLAAAEDGFRVDNGTYTQDAEQLSQYGWSGGGAIIAHADETSYCLQTTDADPALYLTNDSRVVTETPCT